MAKIHKLDQTIINQIAAGEVVERPASVVKELVENSIDAGAKNITVRLQKGGIDKIEVIDDGAGMTVDDLDMAVEPHATSKIENLEDIVNVDTLGFRGEALSSISSVSKVSITSKSDESSESVGYVIHVEGGHKKQPTKTSRDIGTTVSVENIFYNIPARHKFLKTERTEYRKVLDIFQPITLANPNVHFVLEHNGKEIYNLPSIKDSDRGSVHPQRVSQLIKDTQFLPVFYDGEGITVGGYVAHPKHFAKRVSDQYIFVNGRSIWDNGIAKSVTLGANRFIPEGNRLPFVICINIQPKLVDVNVHPRKLEVRFANPYRVFSAVEDAVRSAFSNISKNEAVSEREAVFRLPQEDDRQTPTKHMESRADLFRSGRELDVDESLEFSRMILQDSGGKPYGNSNLVVQQFLNRYLVTEKEGDLWIVDQHAAAERIRFEKLLSEYDGKGVESQSLLVPQELKLSQSDKEFIEENRRAFKWLGFEFDEDKRLKSLPNILSGSDPVSLVKEILESLKDVEDFDSKDQILSGKYRDSVIATMACHSSIRANRKISGEESRRLVEDLLECENSYSCPHGRPIVWKLSPSEIDKHFNRT
jgi:DNA mismatch repair protein MutL